MLSLSRFHHRLVCAGLHLQSESKSRTLLSPKPGHVDDDVGAAAQSRAILRRRALGVVRVMGDSFPNLELRAAAHEKHQRGGRGEPREESRKPSHFLMLQMRTFLEVAAPSLAQAATTGPPDASKERPTVVLSLGVTATVGSSRFP